MELHEQIWWKALLVNSFYPNEQLATYIQKNFRENLKLLVLRTIGNEQIMMLVKCIIKNGIICKQMRKI